MPNPPTALATFCLLNLPSQPPLTPLTSSLPSSVGALKRDVECTEGLAQPFLGRAKGPLLGGTLPLLIPII